MTAARHNNINRPPLPQRTLDYVAHGADEGRRNAELFDAACQFRDAGITTEEAETQLIARATLDGLSEVEARTAIQSAYNHTPREPAVGHGPLPAPASGAATPKREPKVERSAPPLSPVALPEPVANGFTMLLDACFTPSEFVAIAPAREGDAGEVVPTRGVTMTRDEWKQRAVAKGGIEKCFTTALGLFVRINPMAKGGREERRRHGVPPRPRGVRPRRQGHDDPEGTAIRRHPRQRVAGVGAH